MTTTAGERCDVLVVGAGPTGLMMASELVRHGLRCRIIDKAPVPSDKSKALVLHSRSVEIFDQLGLAARAIAAGFPMRAAQFVFAGRKPLRVSLDTIPSRYNFMLMLPQSQTERLLNEHLVELGGGVERQCELVGFAVQPDQVIASVRRPEGGEEQIAASWLVGCDGAHSTVRHTLGLPFEGSTYDEAFLLADVQIDWPFLSEDMYSFMGPEGTIVYFPMGGGRYRITAQMSVANALSAEPSLAEVQALVERMGPPGTLLSQPHWLATFRINRRRVPRYRSGRVFVVGDAAHIHSPAGGQGMNTGLQDAFNLGWKLALVNKGQASGALLDSFQSERHAVAEMVLKNSDRMTRLVMLENPLERTVRDWLMPKLLAEHFVQSRFAVNLSEIGIAYRHSPIVAEFNPKPRAPGELRHWFQFREGPRPGERAPDAFPLAVETPPGRRLLELIDRKMHNLLLFAAKSDNPGALSDLAAEIGRSYAGVITPHLIVPSGTAVPGAIIDSMGMAHRLYGAGAACIYLIRPDGYVGFRACPASRPELERYLAGLLRPAPTPGA